MEQNGLNADELKELFFRLCTDRKKHYVNVKEFRRVNALVTISSEEYKISMEAYNKAVSNASIETLDEFHRLLGVPETEVGRQIKELCDSVTAKSVITEIDGERVNPNGDL